VSLEEGQPKKRLSARERASQRAAEAAAARARDRRRHRLLAVGAPLLVVVLVVAILVTVKATTGGGGPKSGPSAVPANESVIGAVTTVPVSALNTVGTGTVNALPKPVTGAPPLTANGLPRVLYVGAEYCPYCATERWAMVVALSRFGSFSNLGQTTSSSTDVYPSTATLSFHGSTFTSSTVSFTGVEQQGNKVVNGQYAPLDTLSAADQALVTKYDAAPYTTSPGAIPFIDIGNRYIIVGASYDPQVLQGKTAAQIAAALSDPTSAIAKGALGTANVITAAICAITNDKPAAVCNSPGVQAGAKALAGSNS
jgi:hypothetical protein